MHIFISIQSGLPLILCQCTNFFICGAYPMRPFRFATFITGVPGNFWGYVSFVLKFLFHWRNLQMMEAGADEHLDDVWVMSKLRGLAFFFGAAINIIPSNMLGISPFPEFSKSGTPTPPGIATWSSAAGNKSTCMNGVMLSITVFRILMPILSTYLSATILPMQNDRLSIPLYQRHSREL